MPRKEWRESLSKGIEVKSTQHARGMGRSTTRSPRHLVWHEVVVKAHGNNQNAGHNKHLQGWGVGDRYGSCEQRK